LAQLIPRLELGRRCLLHGRWLAGQLGRGEGRVIDRATGTVDVGGIELVGDAGDAPLQLDELDQISVHR
jgi:hypothetical protein